MANRNCFRHRLQSGGLPSELQDTMSSSRSSMTKRAFRTQFTLGELSLAGVSCPAQAPASNHHGQRASESFRAARSCSMSRDILVASGSGHNLWLATFSVQLPVNQNLILFLFEIIVLLARSKPFCHCYCSFCLCTYLMAALSKYYSCA